MPARSPRLVLLLGAAALVALVAACAPAAGPASTPGSTPGVASPTPRATPPATGGTGNVGGGDGPELSVSDSGTRLVVAVADPGAKAWRIRVTGTGPAAGRVLEIELETGDVGYGLFVRSLVDGAIVDENDLSGMIGEPTTAAGGCHPALPVCYGSGDIVLPADGDGILEVVLGIPAPTGPLSIVGATATWTEPFVLGPWTETASFTTAG